MVQEIPRVQLQGRLDVVRAATSQTCSDSSGDPLWGCSRGLCKEETIGNTSLRGILIRKGAYLMAISGTEVLNIYHVHAKALTHLNITPMESPIQCPNSPYPYTSIRKPEALKPVASESERKYLKQPPELYRPSYRSVPEDTRPSRNRILEMSFRLNYNPPDVPHGSKELQEMPLEEAQVWLEAADPRMMEARSILSKGNEPLVG